MRQGRLRAAAQSGVGVSKRRLGWVRAGERYPDLADRDADASTDLEELEADGSTVGSRQVGAL
jgi:hypothetical protein